MQIKIIITVFNGKNPNEADFGPPRPFFGNDENFRFVNVVDVPDFFVVFFLATVSNTMQSILYPLLC